MYIIKVEYAYNADDVTSRVVQVPSLIGHMGEEPEIFYDDKLSSLDLDKFLRS